jgi:hypothetical protein
MHNMGRNPQGSRLSPRNPKTKDPEAKDKKEKAFHKHPVGSMIVRV